MRYKALVAYDGSCYSGWQIQENANSIQAEIEKALSRLHKCDMHITGAGRTDGGVHAYGQVFHFDSDKYIEDDHFTRALNSLLPLDIRIQSVTVVNDDFHSRFDSTGKRYDYIVSTHKNDPFIQKYKMIERLELDVEYMRTCAEVFIGTHDFTSFTSNKIDSRKSRIRTIYKIEVLAEEDHVRMVFIGNGFLRYMVRMLAQVLIEAGKHRLCVEELKEMLEAKDKHVNRYKAPANGLYLMKVYYGDDINES